MKKYRLLKRKIQFPSYHHVVSLQNAVPRTIFGGAGQGKRPRNYDFVAISHWGACSVFAPSTAGLCEMLCEIRLEPTRLNLYNVNVNT